MWEDDQFEQQNIVNDIEQNIQADEVQEEVVDPVKLVKKVRKKRKVRKGRKKQGLLRGFFRFLLTLGLLYLCYYISKMPQWYLDSKAFTTIGSPSVQIVGNDMVKVPHILSALKGFEIPDKPIYMINTNEIEKKIKKLTPVEDVYIRRYAFPARLWINIKERKPILTISPDVKIQPVLAFCEDGTIINKEFLPLNEKFKTVRILSYGNKGDDYKNWDKRKIGELKKIAEDVEYYSKETVEYIDCRNPNDIYVQIKTVKIRLGKIDETIFNRIERIPSILPQVKLIDAKIKYLDLGWEKVNYLKLE